MFFSWYAVMMLAVESQSVINLRLAKIGRGGPEAGDEVRMMLSEKISAAIEAGAAVIMGSTHIGLVDRCRSHVAANKARLVRAAT